MARFKGKLAIVTGAASGLGEATARILAEEGARVLLADVNVSAAEKVAAGLPGSEAVALDVAAPQDWRSLEHRVMRDFGGLDILVNSAAIGWGSGDPNLEAVDIANWRRVFEVNVEGTLLGCQLAMRAMRGRSGSIVNVASTASMSASAPVAAYGASKAAVVHLTRSVAAACEKGRYRIRCNVVLPGMFDTPMNASAPLQHLSAWEAQIPMGRMGDASELANVIAFLASDAASYMTGALVPVDGGLLSRPVVK